MPNEQIPQQPPQPQYGEYAPPSQPFAPVAQPYQPLQYAPPVYTPPPVLRAPEGTKPYTVWIWLILAIPVASFAWTIPELIQLVSSYGDLMSSVFAQLPTDGSTLDPAQEQAILAPLLRQEFGTVGLSIIPALLGWLATGVTIVFAWLDWRELRRRGVPQPFHWAWAFFGLLGTGNLVYVIGRIVVTRRRTGGGFAVLWTFIAVEVVLLVAGIVLATILFSQLLGTITTALPGSTNV